MRRPASPEPQTSPQKFFSSSAPSELRGWLYAFWKFSRPHTIIGTTLSVLSLATIAWALESDRHSYPAPFPILFTLLACLAGNVYIVGLNQLEDVAIDRINKPHLPLAAGEFTRTQARRIIGVMGLLGLALSASQGMWLMGTVWLSLLIGTAYSLPPIRLKRFPALASFCILSVRGLIVNLGLFLHFQHQWNQGIGDRLFLPAPIWALTLFILVFTFAIAIFKDIPDLEGDRQYHISTFTIRLGQRTVFNLSRWVLTACYGGMIVVAPLLSGVNGLGLMITHGILLGVLWWHSERVDLKDKGAIARFYQFIWKLFFLEYLIFPALCLVMGSV
ncbi:MULTISPECIES: homogentisate phytyltransferase [unclassified Leptolyngbya]|uniref:homogentisate phytyltransferase n=1 Tax=unclassified Leptolyngbya TaxID=2650499 RepID=UPI0016867218|nr:MULTISPECIES: homogentisate phytyltransferase [unclassified Leptolyngbya]MBD1910544.1 homogentisate phytyltransferase [Leptolyngbya sp. FACHB-8]MBD2153915.1 homogentisate phytyltransferase [Leptolyngbya sp. FACHB-16]